MTSSSEIIEQLDEKQAELQDFIDDLPRYRELISNAQAQEKAAQLAFRQKQGTFAAASAAKTDTLTATELLSQHESDIETHKREVAQLEEQLAALQKLERLTALATTAQSHHTRLSELVTRTNKQLEQALAEIFETSDKLMNVRSTFRTLAGAEVDHSDDKRALLSQAIAELEQRGVDLAGVLVPFALEEGYTGYVDKNLPVPEPHGNYLLNANTLRMYERQQAELSQKRSRSLPTSKKSNLSKLRTI